MKRLLVGLGLGVALLEGCADQSVTNGRPCKTIADLVAHPECIGSDPTAPGCPFILEVEPIAGFPGLYGVLPNPPGDYAISVNGVSKSVERGQLVTAEPGDIIQGCRACGCTQGVVVR